jgi:hypothetical protein
VDKAGNESKTSVVEGQNSHKENEFALCPPAGAGKRTFLEDPDGFSQRTKRKFLMSIDA